ncbi:MAG: sugar kinase [Acidimicrobiia bacterium]|nr:sugar kinase [Acidimicrobiia bacterium]
MTQTSARVLTIGIHIVDILGRPVEAIPHGQGILLLDEIRMTVAGTAAGTAIDMARLGANVTTIGAIGDDELGQWLTHKMSIEGVDTVGLSIEPSVPTSATMLPIRPNGERPALHVKGANALLSLDHIDWDLVERADYVHVGGTCLLDRLDGEPTAEVLRRAQEAGAITSLDMLGMPDSDFDRLFRPCLPYLDYFLPNDEDALMVSGQTNRADAVTWLHDKGVGATVITLGADGASYVPAGGAEVRVPAYDVDVVDTTGCGDAFSAGFVVGLTEGMDPEGAMELGVASGSLVATGLGSDAGITDRAGLTRFMAETPRRHI